MDDLRSTDAIQDFREATIELIRAEKAEGEAYGSTVVCDSCGYPSPSLFYHHKYLGCEDRTAWFCDLCYDKHKTACAECHRAWHVPEWEEDL